jgi:hypothetical protein
LGSCLGRRARSLRDIPESARHGAVSTPEYAAQCRGQEIEDHQRSERPGSQAVPACGGLFWLAGEPARGVAASQRGQNAGERPPDACANGEARNGARVAAEQKTYTSLGSCLVDAGRPRVAQRPELAARDRVG